MSCLSVRLPASTNCSSCCSWREAASVSASASLAPLPRSRVRPPVFAGSRASERETVLLLSSMTGLWGGRGSAAFSVISYFAYYRSRLFLRFLSRRIRRSRQDDDSATRWEEDKVGGRRKGGREEGREERRKLVVGVRVSTDSW